MDSYPKQNTSAPDCVVLAIDKSSKCKILLACSERIFTMVLVVFFIPEGLMDTYSK